jgi:hypothetical protein
LIHSYTILKNSKLSDNFTICLNPNYDLIKPTENVKKENRYHSKLPDFNLKGRDDKDWFRLNLLFNQIDWSSILEELNPDEATFKFIKILEENVGLVFQTKSEEMNESSKEKSFKSKNKIPKKIRILMRNKRKISKTLLSTKSVNKYLKLNERLEAIENDLKTS